MKCQARFALTLGPGAYSDIPKINRRVKDNRSGNFKSMAARFAPNCPGANAFTYPSNYATPGPGNYIVEGQQVPKKKVRRIRASARKYGERRGAGKATPSIPSKLQRDRRPQHSKERVHGKAQRQRGTQPVRACIQLRSLKAQRTGLLANGPPSRQCAE